jgi:hypothetical protein
VIFFKVELLNQATNAWDTIATIKPEYAATSRLVGWIFRRRTIVIANVEAAEGVATLKAVGLGKRLRGQRRIERTSEIDGRQIKTVIWKDGRWAIPVSWRLRYAAWRV